MAEYNGFDPGMGMAGYDGGGAPQHLAYRGYEEDYLMQQEMQQQMADSLGHAAQSYGAPRPDSGQGYAKEESGEYDDHYGGQQGGGYR